MRWHPACGLSFSIATQHSSVVNGLTDGVVDTWHQFQGARGEETHEGMWCVWEVCSASAPALSKRLTLTLVVWILQGLW